MAEEYEEEGITGLEIAIIGMSGSFPGAADVNTYWENLKNGVESISFYEDEALAERGIPQETLQDPNYVKANGDLDGIDLFDNSFFEYTPREAEIMSPQMRLFHEHAWTTLEHAGYDPDRYAGAIGLYAGSSNTFYWESLCHMSGKSKAFGPFVRTLNTNDYLSTRVSYKLNLKGPSSLVDTACSSSLVAIHMACRSILSGECDMALAGGISLSLPQGRGYLYQKGMIFSADGHLRAFDADASGSVFGNGIGVVLLKPLEEALADGDHIEAVIKGSAANNDGSRKIGYTAPSVQGQAEVIRSTFQMAGVTPETIGYIEAHGTGTTLGDPIEIRGLTQAFNTHRKSYCAIGSSKSNIGHLDVAAGVAGIIKVAFSLKNRQIPPTLHILRPNPEIDFVNSPFYLNTELTSWEEQDHPFRAGISSFGAGGTNAHIILEEPPQPSPSSSGKALKVLLLSAKNEKALATMTDNLRSYLQHHPSANLDDISFTLQVGRNLMPFRKVLVCSTLEQALSDLSSPDSGITYQAKKNKNQPAWGIWLSEHTAIHSEQIKELYQVEPLFRQSLSPCFAFLKAKGMGQFEEWIAHPNKAPFALGEAVEWKSTCPFLMIYGLGAWFTNLGIAPNQIAGTQAGDIAGLCLSGEVSLQEGMEHLISSGQANENVNSLLNETRKKAMELLSHPNSIWVITGSHKDQNSIPPESALPLSLFSEPSPGSCLQELYSCIAHLMIRGVAIDWDQFYAQESRHRLALPTYPFQRQQFPINELNLEEMLKGYGNGSLNPQQNNKPKETGLYYAPTWQRSLVTPGKSGLPEASCWWIFADELGVGTGMAQKLQEMGHKAILIHRGTQFHQENETSFSLAPNSLDQFQSLCTHLSKAEAKPDRIIHLWGTDQTEFQPSQITANKEDSYYSLLHLARSLGKIYTEHQIKWFVVTSNLHEVTGAESLSPGKALSLGPGKVIPKEYKNFSCRSIDLSAPPKANLPLDRWVNQLLAETTMDSPPTPVAYRGQHRWEQIFRPIAPATVTPPDSPFKKGGTYLITGGLGGIGLQIATYAIEQGATQLIITGISDHAAKQEERASRIKNLEAIGAKVLFRRLDAGDLEATRQLVEEAEEQFGQINGVLHCAGIPDGTLIQQRTQAESEKIFAAKVEGTLALNQVFSDKPLDFFFICSSMSAILTGPGQSGYCAANSFQDSFAHYLSASSNFPIVSVNWDRWQGTGMAVELETRYQQLMGAELPGGISVSTALDAVGRVLNQPLPQVAVSTADLADWDFAEDSEVFNQAMENIQFEATTYERSDLSTPYVEPANKTEKNIADLWQTLFGIDQIGREDNFFELGGDSLKGIILTSRIHKALDVVVPIPVLFARPTLKELAQYITGQTEEEEFVSIAPVEEQESYALSHAQQRLWLLCQFEGASRAFNEQGAYQLIGKMEVEAFKNAFQASIDRNESLRTRFIQKEGEPRQQILSLKEAAFPIEVVDLTGSEEPEQAIREMANLDARTPFDLTNWPLLRVKLIQLSENRSVFLFTVHHIISDASSKHILLDEILSGYYARVKGQELLLPPHRIQYKDYAVWHNQLLAQNKLAASKAYWMDRLSGTLPTLNLPLDLPRPVVQTFDGASLKFTLEEGATTGMKQLSANAQTTMFATLLSVFKLFLYKHSGQEDLIVGSPVIGRGHSDLEKQIGFYVNMLPLRTQLNAEMTFRELLRQVGKQTIEALEHQEYPFDLLVDDLRVKRDLSRSPIFDASFIWEFEMDHAPNPGESLQIEVYETENRLAKMDLLLFAREANGQITFSFDYNINLFKETSIVLFIDKFKLLCEQILQDPDRSLQAFSVELDQLYGIDQETIDIKIDF